MSTRIKDLKEMTIGFQEGFSGTSAVDDASISATDTVIGVDTHDLRDARTLVPIGARFTTAGIATIRTVTATQNSTQYTLDMTSPSSGTFTVTHDGNTTSAIAYDVAAATLQSDLEGLASIGSGNVAVTENADVYTITFQGSLANTAQTITVDGSGLTAPNSHVLTQVHDGTSTWEVTFTPAIASGSVPSDDDVITWYPRRLFFEVETGDVEWSEDDNPIVRLSRGLINGLRRGDEAAMTVTSAFAFSKMRATSTASDMLDSTPSSITALTPYEVLNNIGFASDWMPSSHGGVCEPYSVDIFVIDKPQCSSEEAEVIIFPQFAKQNISPTVQGGIVNFNGVCAAKRPIITSVTNDDDAIGVIY